MACNRCCNHCCHICCHHRPTTPSCATLARDVNKLIDKIETKVDQLEDAFDALEDRGCIKSARNWNDWNHCNCCNRNSNFHYGICR